MDPVFALKIRAEKDPSISGEAFRLLCRIVSERLRRARGEDPEDPFPLPWSKVAALTWCSEREAYYRISELTKRNYLKFDGLKGCPPINHFSVVVNSGENQSINSAKSCRIDSARNCRNDSARNCRDHISIPYGKKIDRKGPEEPASPGERNRAAGADKGKRTGAAAPGTPAGKNGGDTHPFDVAEHLKTWRAEMGFDQRGAAAPRPPAGVASKVAGAGRKPAVKPDAAKKPRASRRKIKASD